MSGPNVLLIITQDTKEQEAHYVRQILEGAGCSVIHLDPSIRRTVGGAEISPEDVAGAAGHTIEDVRALGHEGKCQAVMTEGAVKCALAAHEAQGLSGVLSIGGSMGTGSYVLAGTQACESLAFSSACHGAGRAISIELPTMVVREITYTEPAVRGDTSGKVMKPAKINTGHELPVPLFCAIGDKIEIDTRTGEYRSRVM